MRAHLGMVLFNGIKTKHEAQVFAARHGGKAYAAYQRGDRVYLRRVEDATGREFEYVVVVPASVLRGPPGSFGPLSVATYASSSPGEEEAEWVSEKRFGRLTEGRFVYAFSERSQAVRVAEEVGGELWTVRDAEGTRVAYSRGAKGFVDVLEYVVVMVKPLPDRYIGKAPYWGQQLR